MNDLDSAPAPSGDPFEFFQLEEASSDGHPHLPQLDNAQTREEDQIVAFYGDQAITEGSKLNAIAGTSTMHSNILEFDNRQRILFVFSVRNLLSSLFSRYTPVDESYTRSDELSPDRRGVNPPIKRTW